MIMRQHLLNSLLELGHATSQNLAFAHRADVSVSYGEAARWLDSGEQVDGVAMPREIADWVGDFVNTHYKPEPKKKVRRNDPLGLDRRGT